jgi:hypothetical protein
VNKAADMLLEPPVTAEVSAAVEHGRRALTESSMHAEYTKAVLLALGQIRQELQVIRQLLEAK